MRNWRSPQISKNSTDLPLNTKPNKQPRSALKSEGKHYFEPQSEVHPSPKHGHFSQHPFNPTGKHAIPHKQMKSSSAAVRKVFSI